MVDWLAAARRRFRRSSHQETRSASRTVAESTRASRTSLGSYANRGVPLSPPRPHSLHTSPIHDQAQRSSSSVIPSHEIPATCPNDNSNRRHSEVAEHNPDLVAPRHMQPDDRGRMFGVRQKQCAEQQQHRDSRRHHLHVQEHQEQQEQPQIFTSRNTSQDAPNRSSQHRVAVPNAAHTASNSIRAPPSSSSSPVACFAKSSSVSAGSTSPFYITNPSSVHTPTYRRSKDLSRARKHRGLDALALVRCLPCAASGWVLVKRDVSVISSLFKTPWMSMWAELRGGMILLYDPDSHQHATASPGQYYQNLSNFDVLNQSGRASTRNLLRQRHFSYYHGQTSPITSVPSAYHTPTTSSINSWMTQTPDRVQSVSSSSITMSMQGATIGSSTTVSGAGCPSGGFRSPSSSRRDQQRAVRIVFVVSDAVVDIKNTRSFSQIYIRRPDGAALYMRVASHIESQRWSVALAVATVPYKTVKLSDFVPVSPIGRGASGKVFLVREARSGDRLALKIIPKAHVFRSTLTFQHVLNERLVLEAAADSPFLVQMRYAFQSDTHLYLATSFYDGGDVFSLLQANSGRLAERHACRMVGEVILALESLHVRSIVYRDLKPENVVLDGTGHIRLADFGLAKILEPDDGLLTQTVCGTTAYAAPEMLRSRAYSFSLDMWCLGVFIYHVLTGRTPYNFKNRSMEEMEDIQRSRPIRYYPSMSHEAVSLIRGLLQLDPSLRPTLDEVKAHPFFRTIDWHALARKEPHPDNLTEFVSAGVSHGVRLSPVSNAPIPGASGAHDAAMKSRSTSRQQSQNEAAPALGATVTSGQISRNVAAGSHAFLVNNSYGGHSNLLEVGNSSHGFLNVASAALGGHGAHSLHSPNVMAVNGPLPLHSPVLRHHSANGPGSSLHTNSSDYGFPVDAAEGSTGDVEDSANLDDYLLRNINKEEWRNVSFSNEGENTVIVTDHFPTILSNRTREVETVVIAGWSWISEFDAAKHDENTFCTDGFRISVDHNLVPPRPFFSRRSLPEHDRRIMSGVRRSFGDRPGASSGGYAPSGLFDVGPDRYMPSISSGVKDRPDFERGRAMRRRSADCIPASERQFPLSASNRQLVDIAPDAARIAENVPPANEPPVVAKPSTQPLGSQHRVRHFGISNSFQEPALPQQRVSLVTLERAPRSTSSSAQATQTPSHTQQVAASVSKTDFFAKRSSRRQNPGFPVSSSTLERESTGEFDQIRANLYADPMNTDPCRDLPSLGTRSGKTDRGSLVFRRKH